MHETMLVRSERFYSAHHTLLRIAKHSLLLAESGSPGWEDEQFIAVTMSGLAIEAICNAIGEKAVEDWCDHETSSPTAKLRVICANLDVTYDKREEPWVSLRWLSKIRNKIAHPKTEQIVTNVSISAEKFKRDGYRDAPKSKLEREITLASARKSVNAVRSAIEILCAKLEEDAGSQMTMNSWESTSWKDRSE